jgi:hypothetical protein
MNGFTLLSFYARESSPNTDLIEVWVGPSDGLVVWIMILWHVDPLLDNGREISNYPTATAPQTNMFPR